MTRSFSMGGKSKKGGGGATEDPNAWMITFGDLLMLLLTFFVLLLTMKSLDGEDTQETFQYFLESQGPMDHVGGVFDEGSPIRKKPVTTVSSTEQLEKALELMGGIKSIRSKGTDAEKVRDIFSFSEDHRGVVISMEASHLFNTGAANIRPDGLPILDAAANLIRNAANDILIMGHTDNVPLKKGRRFSSNLDLSYYRALSVFYYLIDSCGLFAEQFAVGGYGGAMPQYPNDSKENRAKNRRVEFILRQK